MGFVVRCEVAEQSVDNATWGRGVLVDEAVERAQLVQAATSLVLSGGYPTVTLEHLADAVGITPHRVAELFGDVDAVVLTAAEACFQRFASATPTWSRTDPVPGLHDEISRRLLLGIDAARTAPEYWSLGIVLLLTARSGGAPQAQEMFRAVRASAKNAIAEWWGRILPDDVLEADPALPRRLTAVHLALVDGAFVAQKAGVSWNLTRLVRTVSEGLSSYLVAEGVSR